MGLIMTRFDQKLAIQHEQVKYRYDAFLSYAHEDKPSVAWLHKLLTTFWVPWKRRRSVFMDQESLPAGGGLSRNLKDALEKSRFLIVCCSKNSAESNWVHLEITEFLNSHPAENILACIVGDRATEATFSVPPMIDCVENELLKDEIFKPDLRGKPESLKGQALKGANKEALALLAPLVNLQSKDALLDRRKKNLIVGSVLLFIIAQIGIGLKLWDDRDESQINKVLSQSSDLVRMAATDSSGFKIVEDCLQALAISGWSAEAFEAARRIENEGSRSKAMGRIVEALVKTGKTDGALDAAREIRDANIHSRALVDVVEAMANAGRTDEALDATRKIADPTYHPPAMARIVKALAKAGKTDKALEVALKIRKIEQVDL